MVDAAAAGSRDVLDAALADHPPFEAQDLETMLREVLAEGDRDQHDSLAAAFRVVAAAVGPLQDLGLPPPVADLARAPQGLVLVAGPSGSRRSTALAAMVGVVNAERPCLVVTVEDPIEFVHPPGRATVQQREVGRDAASLAAALTDLAGTDANVRPDRRAGRPGDPRGGDPSSTRSWPPASDGGCCRWTAPSPSWSARPGSRSRRPAPPPTTRTGWRGRSARLTAEGGAPPPGPDGIARGGRPPRSRPAGPNRRGPAAGTAGCRRPTVRPRRSP